jgi:hypothetical protein
LSLEEQVIGWGDYHLHGFIINDTYYGIPDPDYGLEMKNEKKYKTGTIGFIG